jgi:hypothetical protein
MMGQHDRSEALFYYFRLEDQAPETHLLRLIEKSLRHRTQTESPCSVTSVPHVRQSRKLLCMTQTSPRTPEENHRYIGPRQRDRKSVV